jgi:iron complex outermembrane receptor protein
MRSCDSVLGSCATVIATAGLFLAGSLAFGTEAASTSPGPEGSTAVESPGSTGLEEVVVTAQRRPDTISKVAVAITAFGSTQLAERSITVETDLQGAVPGLTVKTGESAKAVPSAAVAQSSAPPTTSSDQIPEIIVTAQKREQSANDVGISIVAASGEDLKERGIDSVQDLARLVPGLTVQNSAFNSISYTLRGVGFFNSDLATPPTVSVYVDEAPLPYPAMTKLAAFDLERVEVLKGPQGILYGQNATGGAVNYIAAKPTDKFDAGADLGYGRFNRTEGDGFVSGPLSDTLNARLALQFRTGSPWQESTTRPGDELGRIEEFQARLSFDWHPSEQLKSQLVFTLTHDGSEALAAQLLAPAILYPAVARQGLATYPVVLNPRAADWTPGYDYKSDTSLFHVSWRFDYELTPNVTFTSLSSYSEFHMNYGEDQDGTRYVLYQAEDKGGRLNTILQEFRLTGRADKLDWLIGGNFDHDSVADAVLASYTDKDACHLFESINPEAFCDEATNIGHYDVNTYGIFGRVEYNLTDALNVESGVRYNNDKRVFDGCGIADSQNTGEFFDVFQSLVNGGIPITPVNKGHCFVLDPNNHFRPVNDVHVDLHQDNVSWREGVNWKIVPDTMLYANVSKGYKAGTVPVVGAATTIQFKPVPQESVLAYETGIKSTFWDRHAQFNAAAFYYDYKDKQLKGTILDPAFGPLEALVTIPKSRVEGAEAQLILHPTGGLTLDSSLTYVDTRITEFTGFNAVGVTGDQAGTPFPFSPKWQSVTDLSDRFPISSQLNGFIGGTYTYNSKTYSGIGAPQILYIGSFGLLDLRTGVETPDGKYRVALWGKNVTDRYHWTSAFDSFNTIVRFVGEPATYGVQFSYRFR